MGDFVCGANAADYHYAGVNWGRDLPEPTPVGYYGTWVVELEASGELGEAGSVTHRAPHDLGRHPDAPPPGHARPGGQRPRRGRYSRADVDH